MSKLISYFNQDVSVPRWWVWLSQVLVILGLINLIMVIGAN